MTGDPRRHIPHTDVLLSRPEFVDAAARLGPPPVRAAVRAAQERARQGLITPDAVAAAALETLAEPTSARAVLNATGVVLHTNLGRAPLSDAAIAAVAAASGYTDLELDLGSNRRTPRGEAVRRALLAAVPAAEDALVVNNGAAALVLAVTALADEVVVSRGELVEIGDGFRVGELVTSTGARLVEVGATNRTLVGDYGSVLAGRHAQSSPRPPRSGVDEAGLAEASTDPCDGDVDAGVRPGGRPARTLVLKVHPSNFTIVGFTAEVGVGALAELAAAHGVPLLVDTGSGLLAPDPALPTEPAAAAALAAGADLVVCSADKLLGGPQAGLILGRADLIGRLRRHPLARALRVDKLRLAALEATLTNEVAPVTRYRTPDAEALRGRAHTVAAAVVADAAAATAHDDQRPAGEGPDVDVIPCQGRVGGGGAPDVVLPGWAVALGGDAEAIALRLRTGTPAVLARVEGGRVLVDLRCIPPDADPLVAEAIRRALGHSGSRHTRGPQRYTHGAPTLEPGARQASGAPSPEAGA